MLQLAQVVEDLLRAPHREGGDQEPAAGVGRARRRLGQLVGVVVGWVQPVAVGGLDEQHVGRRHRIRIAHDGHAVTAEVAREDHEASADPAPDEAGAQDVAGVDEARLDARRRREGLVEAHRLDLGQRAIGVAGREQRQRGVVLRGVVAVVELRLLLLQVGRVGQHHPQEIGGAVGTEHRAPVSAAHQSRQIATVVQMRVGQIVEAEKVAGSRKLMKLRVDIGDEVRQVVAGIAEAYDGATLLNRKVVVVVNLKPARLMGVESNGMIVAASVDGRPVLATFTEEVPNGSLLK